MHEISSLTWPTAPYSSAHRPIQRTTHLLTGLALQLPSTAVCPGNRRPASAIAPDAPAQPVGWAVVHVPVHRTRTIEAAAARFGIHAAVSEGANDVGECWLSLDKILLAGRRQAVALAGLDLRADVQSVSRQLQVHAGHRGTGVTALLSDLAVTSDGVRRRRQAAELIDLAEIALSEPARNLLERHPARVPAAPAARTGARAGVRDRRVMEDRSNRRLAALVAHAAAVALAAAGATDRYVLRAEVDLLSALDAEAGDLLPFRELAPSYAGGHDTGATR